MSTLLSWSDLRAIRLQLYRFIDDGWSNHKGFPAGKLWFGLFSVGKLGHLGRAITARAILVHAGLDSKEITAVIYSWHKWVKTQSPPSAPFSPAACWTHHIIFTSPLLYPTILPTWSFSFFPPYLLILIASNYPQSRAFHFHFSTCRGHVLNMYVKTKWRIITCTSCFLLVSSVCKAELTGSWLSFIFRRLTGQWYQSFI